jgi:hypothetical protein
MEHPPNSPDLAPSEFSLFSKLKLILFFESRGDCSCRRAFFLSYIEQLQGWDNGPGAVLE